MGDLIHLPLAQVERLPAPKLSSRQIYRRGKAAVKHLNASCPSGVVMHMRTALRSKNRFVVKHGYRTSIAVTEVPYRSIVRTDFCCHQQLADLRMADHLPWPWSWLWRLYRCRLQPEMFEDPKVLRNPLVCISQKRSSSA